jgi:hypothetical protein
MALDVMIISTHQHFRDSNTPVDTDKCFFGRHEAVEHAPAPRVTQKQKQKQKQNKTPFKTTQISPLAAP